MADANNFIVARERGRGRGRAGKGGKERGIQQQVEEVLQTGRGEIESGRTIIKLEEETEVKIDEEVAEEAEEISKVEEEEENIDKDDTAFGFIPYLIHATLQRGRKCFKN